MSGFSKGKEIKQRLFGAEFTEEDFGVAKGY